MIYNPKNNPFINELNLIEGNHQQIQEQQLLIQPEEKVKTAKEMMEEYFKNNKHLIIQ